MSTNPRNALAYLANRRTSGGAMADRRAPRGGARSPRGAMCCPDCGGPTYGGDLICLDPACDAD